MNKLRMFLTGIVAVALVGCGGSASKSMSDGEGAVSKQANRASFAYDFKSLNQMVATTDAAVVGTVKSVEPGDVIGGKYTGADEAAGTHDGDGGIQLQEVTLDIETVMYGELPSAESIVLELVGSAELPIPPVGSRGAFFLWRDSDRGTFTVVNDEGQYVEDSSGRLTNAVAEDSDAWVLELEEGSVAELVSAVEESVRAVESGPIKPAQPAI